MSWYSKKSALFLVSIVLLGLLPNSVESTAIAVPSAGADGSRLGIRQIGQNSRKTSLLNGRGAASIINPTTVVAASKHGKAAAATAHHKMPIHTLVINIVADLCPHGMMPLAFAIGQGPTGIVPAIALVGVFGFLSAYTMTVFAKLAEQTQSNSISELWGKLLSEKTRWMADAAVFSLCFGCCVFYSAFAGDIFGALTSAAGLTGTLGKRWTALGIVSLLCLLPLCLLEDISSLQFSSLLGATGILYTVLFHIIRFVDGSYVPKTGAMALLLSSKMQPKWPNPKFTMWSVNKGTLTLVNMLCVAFLAHYNAINYYKELDHADEKRYKTAIGIGFGTSFTVFVAMMLLGYSMFGTVAQPLLLNNFHRTKDLLATGARFATGLAITFAYPLMFAGLKSSMFSLIDASMNTDATKPTKGKKNIVKSTGASKETKQAAIVAALSLITAIAFKCGEEDVSVVLGIVGSVLGCGVAYVLPGALNLMHMRNRKKLGLKNVPIDVILSHFLVAAGLVFGCLGVKETISSAGSHGHH